MTPRTIAAIPNAIETNGRHSQTRVSRPAMSDSTPRRLFGFCRSAPILRVRRPAPGGGNPPGVAAEGDPGGAGAGGGGPGAPGGGGGPPGGGGGPGAPGGGGPGGGEAGPAGRGACSGSRG